MWRATIRWRARPRPRKSWTVNSLFTVPKTKVYISCLCHRTPRAYWLREPVGVPMGTLVLVGLGLFYPFLWGPRLLPRRALKVISVLYSRMECSAVWRPTVPGAVVSTSAPDVPGLPAVSSVSVSVFPSPTLVFNQHGHIMHLLYAKCHAASLGYRRRGGGRSVPRAWNCTEAGVYGV